MDYRPKLLVFVRHAESVWNRMAPHKRGKIKAPPPEMKGIPDHGTPLSEEGAAQAIKTGQKLAELFGSFDEVYYSPWRRTAETARIIVEQFPEPALAEMKGRLFRNLFLMEQNFGDLDVGTGDPKDIRGGYNRFRKLREMAGKFYLRPPNGESWADVAMRTHQFLDIVFRENRDKHRILVVTHGIALTTLRYHLERLTEQDVEAMDKAKIPKNCGVYSYQWNESLSRYQPDLCNRTFY